MIEKRENGEIKSTETITPMTLEEVSAFKERWRILWHPEMTETLDLIDQEGYTRGDPEIQNDGEATPQAQPPQTREESGKAAKPEKKKNMFWCCC